MLVGAPAGAEAFLRDGDIVYPLTVLPDPLRQNLQPLMKV